MTSCFWMSKSGSYWGIGVNKGSFTGGTGQFSCNFINSSFECFFNVGLLIGSLQALASPGRRHISSSVPPLTSLVSITFIFFFHLFPGSAFSLSSIPSSCSSLSPAEQSFSDMPVRCYSLFRVPMMRPPGNWSCSQDQHRGWGGGWECVCVYLSSGHAEDKQKKERKGETTNSITRALEDIWAARKQSHSYQTPV